MLAGLANAILADATSPVFIATVASIYLVHSAQMYALTESVAARAGVPGRISRGGMPTVWGGILHAIVAVLVVRLTAKQAARLV